MHYEDCIPLAGEFAGKLIDIKIGSLLKAGTFDLGDEDDIRQELWLHLHRRWPDFNPHRGSPKAFIRELVANKIVNLIAQRSAAKRDAGKRAFSLNERVGLDDGGDCELGETIDSLSLLRLAGLATDRDFPEDHLAMDLAEALAGLAPDDIDLCQQLVSESIAEIARRCGVTRETIYDRIHRIRKRIGPRLDGYFEESIRHSASRAGNRG